MKRCRYIFWQRKYSVIWSRWQKKNILLAQKEGKAVIRGSYGLLYRAVYNLVENAIKYNEEGGQVILEIVQTEKGVICTISDTGIGIPDEYKSRIFEPFFRVDKSRSRKMGGAGIGLSLAKEVLERHGGTVFVQDNTPVGTVVTIKFY